MPGRPLKRSSRGGVVAPPRLYSLTAEQTELLREAAASTPDGIYIGYGARTRIAVVLVNGGTATFRTVQQTSDTPRSVNDARPCTWEDHYLVPTPYGLELLDNTIDRQRK